MKKDFEMKKYMKKVALVGLSVLMLNAPLEAKLFDSLKDFSSINATIDNILNNLNGIKGELDGIFDGFSVDSVIEEMFGDNELMKCLVKTEEFESLIGDLGIPSGMCSMFDWVADAKGLFDNDIAKCFGADSGSVFGEKNMKAMEGIMGRLKTACGQGITIDEFGTEQETWGGDREGGGVVAYNPYVITSSGTPEVSSVILSPTDATSEVKLEDSKYPNGKTMKEVFGTGGALDKEIENNPAGSTSDAHKKLKKATMGLKIITAKMRTGKEQFNEGSIGLSKDYIATVEASNDIASLVGMQYPDYQALLVGLVKELRTAYADIDTGEIKTLSAYYKKEKEIYVETIQASEQLEKFIRNSGLAMRTFYNQKLMKMMKDKNYLMLPSEKVASRLAEEVQNTYRFNAMLQSNEESHIKTHMAIEGHIINANIERVKARAYPASSIFRGDIAKEEINEMLKAVDEEIR